MTKITTDADAMNAIKEAMNYAPEDLRNKAWTAFAYLAARLASTSPAPDGVVLVPMEPTPEMIEAGVRSLRCDMEVGRRPHSRTASRSSRNAYVTMIAAAPQPVVEKDNG